MKFYFAPLVGVTGFVYRNAHNEMFHTIDKYFAPFISPQEQGVVKQKELRDILPENNKGTIVVPQILSNNASYVIQTQKQLKEYGYDEVNINLGCPSAPVVSRGRGSGFLAHKEELDGFLEEIFTAGVTRVSVKTRIGKNSPEEFYDIMEIYNKYEMEELIIHPRIQTDFYKNTPNRKVFLDAFAISRNPVCYNGDINTVADYKQLIKDCPNLSMVMLGRGILANPNLVSEIKTGSRLTSRQLLTFHQDIYNSYRVAVYDNLSVLSRMKQFWFYLVPYLGKHNQMWLTIKECSTLEEYNEYVSHDLQVDLKNDSVLQ